MCNEKRPRYTYNTCSWKSNLPDSDLVRQIGTGDREAEAELYRRMAPRIRLYGLRHLRNEHGADDLVQQVLLTTLEPCERNACVSPRSWHLSYSEPVE